MKDVTSEKTQAVIHRFLELVELFCQAIEKQYGVKASPGMQGHGFFPKKGFLNLHGIGIVEYDFHGAGCWVQFPNKVEIDFDFGKDWHRQAFNEWFLWNFIESVPGNFGYNSRDEFMESFKQLIELGIIDKDETTGHYLLCSK